MVCKPFILHLQEHTIQFCYIMRYGKKSFAVNFKTVSLFQTMKLFYIGEGQYNMLTVKYGHHSIYLFFYSDTEQEFGYSKCL